MKRIHAWILCLVVALSLSPTSGAQIFGDDGLFTGNCWDVVQDNVPVFPAYSETSLGICWKDCALENRVRLKLVLPAPVKFACGYYSLQNVGLFNALTGTPIWSPSNFWYMIYTRTWVESATINNQPVTFQVWRFLINGEVTPSAQMLANPDPCLIPKSTFQGNPQPIHYSGYVDYALNTTTNQWNIAFGVQHACDAFTHNSFSKYPLGGHPERSFCIVAPSDFIPSATLPGIEGSIETEAMRSYRFANWPNCESEQAVEGKMEIGGRECPCATTPVLNGQFIQFKQETKSVCGSKIEPWGHPFPWGGPGLQMSVGTWVNPTYPGKESLYFVWDPAIYTDGLTNNQTKELFVGVGTTDGWLAKLFQNNGQYARNFIDCQNVYVLPNTTQFTLMAGLFISDKLYYINCY